MNGRPKLDELTILPDRTLARAGAVPVKVVKAECSEVRLILKLADGGRILVKMEISDTFWHESPVVVGDAPK